MERKYYKSLNFDFDTAKLEQFAGSKTKPYYELRRTMKELGFEHRQGSGYVSKEKINFTNILDIVKNLYERHEWFPNCVKRFDVTNISSFEQFDLNEQIINAKIRVQKRMASDPLYAAQVRQKRKQISRAGEIFEQYSAEKTQSNAPSQTKTPFHSR